MRTSTGTEGPPAGGPAAAGSASPRPHAWPAIIITAVLGLLTIAAGLTVKWSSPVHERAVIAVGAGMLAAAIVVSVEYVRGLRRVERLAHEE